MVVLTTSSDGATERSAGEYGIRWYEPGDRDDLLDLFEESEHWERGGGPEWFAWKYEENPAADRVPVVVATHGGSVVGARPFLPLRMRAGGETTVGLQTCDTVVRADHRRRGVFTAMTSWAYDRFARLEPTFAFHLPNAVAREAYRSIGATEVGEVPTYYRIHRPLAMLRERRVVREHDAIDVALTAGAWTYLHARDAARPSPSDVRVERHDEVPAGTFADLYRRGIPRQLHAVRDEAFYRWRFSNPDWSYSAFTAWRDDQPVAGLVTGTRAEGQVVTYLVETVPLVGGDGWREALSALLCRALRAHDAVDLVAASGRVVPPGLLADFGFHGDDVLPLSAAADPTRLLVSWLDGGSGTRWRLGDVDVAEPENWLLPFSEQDTA